MVLHLKKPQPPELNGRSSKAFFKVSYVTVERTKAYSIGEAFGLPTAVKMAEIIPGRQYGNCHQILLEDSQKTVEDLRKQVLQQIMQCGRCTTLLTDLTDVSYMPHLRVYAGLFQQ